MASKHPSRRPVAGKRRTRQHIIADLSVNHLERHVLLCGYSVERLEHDYGIDLNIYTYDDKGEIEPDRLPVQMKATDRLHFLADGQHLALEVDRADLKLWLREPMPCILVVYNAAADKAYWLYVQRYFAKLDGFDMSELEGVIRHDA